MDDINPEPTAAALAWSRPWPRDRWVNLGEDDEMPPAEQFRVRGNGAANTQAKLALEQHPAFNEVAEIDAHLHLERAQRVCTLVAKLLPLFRAGRRCA